MRIMNAGGNSGEFRGANAMVCTEYMTEDKVIDIDYSACRKPWLNPGDTASVPQHAN